MKSEGCGCSFLFFLTLILKIPVQFTYSAVTVSGVTIQRLSASICHLAPSLSPLLHPQPLFHPQLPTPSQPGSRLFALYWYSFFGVTHLWKFGCDRVENIYRLKKESLNSVNQRQRHGCGNRRLGDGILLCLLGTLWPWWGPSGAGCCVGSSVEREGSWWAAGVWDR